MKTIKVIIEKSGTGYSAYIPDLPGCVMTGSCVDEIRNDLSGVIELHLEGMKEDGIRMPVIFDSEYQVIYSYDVETFLSYYNKIFTRRALSRITGINESLLSQYASGLKHPRAAQAKKIEKGLHQLARELLQVSL